MRKLSIALGLLAGYVGLCSLQILPDLGGSWSIAMYVFMALIPIGLFTTAIRSFHRWHKNFHRMMVLEGIQMRRSS
jgi:hypothetical protein